MAAKFKPTEEEEVICLLNCFDSPSPDRRHLKRKEKIIIRSIDRRPPIVMAMLKFLWMLLLLFIACTTASGDPDKNGGDPEEIYLRNQFHKYDKNGDQKLNLEEYMMLSDSIRSSTNLLRAKPCGKHLLATCQTIEKLFNQQTKAVMLHRLCEPCSVQLKTFPVITGNPHLPRNWRKMPLEKLVVRDVVKRTGKEDGRWLTGKEYLQKLRRL